MLRRYLSIKAKEIAQNILKGGRKPAAQPLSEPLLLNSVKSSKDSKKEEIKRVQDTLPVAVHVKGIKREGPCRTLPVSDREDPFESVNQELDWYKRNNSTFSASDSEEDFLRGREKFEKRAAEEQAEREATKQKIFIARAAGTKLTKTPKNQKPNPQVSPDIVQLNSDKETQSPLIKEPFDEQKLNAPCDYKVVRKKDAYKYQEEWDWCKPYYIPMNDILQGREIAEKREEAEQVKQEAAKKRKPS